MAENWNEKLRCAKCDQHGIVRLSQVEGDFAPTVNYTSDGFKVVRTEYGPDFYCAICNIAAVALDQAQRQLAVVAGFVRFHKILN